MSEMRNAIRPLLKGWGFENPPKDAPDWFGSSRLNTWVRERDGFSDEIWFTWDRGRPIYSITLATDQIERMLRPDETLATASGKIHFVKVLDWRVYLLGGLIDRWSERSDGRRSPKAELQHVTSRLCEANRFFVMGEVSRLMLRRGSYGAGPLQPVFWWRQGAAGEARIHEARARQERRRGPAR